MSVLGLTGGKLHLSCLFGALAFSPSFLAKNEEI
jgi:hypothetical protein